MLSRRLVTGGAVKTSRIVITRSKLNSHSVSRNICFISSKVLTAKFGEFHVLTNIFHSLLLTDRSINIFFNLVDAEMPNKPNLMANSSEIHATKVMQRLLRHTKLNQEIGEVTLTRKLKHEHAPETLEEDLPTFREAAKRNSLALSQID